MPNESDRGTPHGFLKVPRALLAIRGLSSTEKLVAAHITDREQLFRQRGGSFHMSAAAIGAALGIAEQTIRRAVASLERKGFASVDRRGGRTCVVRMETTPVNMTEVACDNPGQDERTTSVKMNGDPGQGERRSRLIEIQKVDSVEVDATSSTFLGGEACGGPSRAAALPPPAHRVEGRDPEEELVDAIVLPAWGQFMGEYRSAGGTLRNTDPNRALALTMVREGSANGLPRTMDAFVDEMHRTADGQCARIGRKDPTFRPSFKSIIEHFGRKWGDSWPVGLKPPDPGPQPPPTERPYCPNL